MKIGLTGGIACGKSTVGAMLMRRGALLVDADQVAREVVLPGEPALAAVAARFGKEMLNADGSLDRKALGTAVFSDSDKLRDLEAILHPAIRARMWEQMNRYEEEDPGRLILADIPLLYETGQHKLYDGVLVVYVPRGVQLERLMFREPSLTRDQATRRISLQKDIEEKKRMADWVIDNSGSLKNTERQVEEFWTKLGLT